MTLLPHLPLDPAKPRLVIVEPDRNSRNDLLKCLGSTYDVAWFDGSEALAVNGDCDSQAELALLSWGSVENPLLVLRQILREMPGAPVLLLCGPNDTEDMAFALKLGATGFVQMPLNGDDLLSEAAKVAASRTKGNREAAVRETPLGDGLSVIRSGHCMKLSGAEATRVAQSDIPVLVLGESGTGKEVLARYIHAMSSRSDKIFMKVNCAALPAELLESELYGHVRGAFTGAVKNTAGRFETCDGGTLFLDEIGEMPASAQAKLLHVLQDGVYYRLGDSGALRSDVRIIAATNINVKAAIQQKLFRRDLYYRLSGFCITLPPLRERQNEIPAFAEYFMKKAAIRHQLRALPIPAEMLDVFRRHDWPGNLRELENVINRYLVMGDAHSIMADLGLHLVHRTATVPAAPVSEAIGLKQYLDTIQQGAEAARIAAVLEDTKWNRRSAARRMQISYSSLLHKIKRHGLAPGASPSSLTVAKPVTGSRNLLSPVVSDNKELA